MQKYCGLASWLHIWKFVIISYKIVVDPFIYRIFPIIRIRDHKDENAFLLFYYHMVFVLFVKKYLF